MRKRTILTGGFVLAVVLGGCQLLAPMMAPESSQDTAPGSMPAAPAESVAPSAAPTVPTLPESSPGGDGEPSPTMEVPPDPY